MNVDQIKERLESLRTSTLKEIKEYTNKYNEYTDNTSYTVLLGEQYVVHVDGILRAVEEGYTLCSAEGVSIKESRIVLCDPLLPMLFSFARAREFANACGGMAEAYDSYLLNQIKEMKESIVTIDRRIKELNTI